MKRSLSYMAPILAVVISTCTIYYSIRYQYLHVWDTLARREAVSLEVREIAEKALQNPTDRHFPEELLRRARGNYSFGAVQATVALGKIGKSASPYILDIASLMRSSNPYVQREAALALARLGPLSEPALPMLIDRVTNGRSDDTTWFAAEAIGNIGVPAIDCLPLLYEKLGTGPSPFDDSLRQAIKQLEQVKASRNSAEA